MQSISKRLGITLSVLLLLSVALAASCAYDDITLDEKDMRKYLEMMFNGQHVEAMEKYYAEDVTVESSLLGAIVGRDKIIEVLDNYFKLVKEQHVPATIIVSSNEAAIELLSTMVVKADFADHKAGDTWNARFNMHYSFDGNKIKRVSIYTYCKPCSQEQMKIPGI